MPGRQWDNTWKASQDAITAAQASIRSHSRTRLPVQRINILEASVLDSEIYSLLEMSFATVLGSARALEQSAGPTPTWRRLLGLGIRLAVTGATIMTNTSTRESTYSWWHTTRVSTVWWWCTTIAWFCTS